MLRIVTINLNGIRSACAKGFLTWLAQEDADVVCLQELRAQEPDLAPEMRAPAGYQGYFHCADKRGYSGVGIYTKRPPDRVVAGVGRRDIDAEGRYLELVFGALSVVSVYLPSGSSGPERQAAKFAFMDHFFPQLATLAQCGREVVLCGDFNIAHQEIDLKNWRGNRNNSGFLPEERAWFTRVLGELSFVDVYRALYPAEGEGSYTWWSHRGQAWAKNVGWRIDYQIATPGLAARARAARVYKDQRFSDHAPLIIDYDL
ncbi:exodeoxyribonuclease III [Acidiferrobacter sp.]|jgi:exodeoxyribonuclease-3|uniref:exodeoxyribonuclease III n=1 Tax=Acidiferrobacter sp. TaxID=1872107 RepID=UPI00261ABFC3|nr:exodeoxyribonuclease III [Acidiferrobacter sp.]